MDIEQRLSVLHSQVYMQFNGKVDCHYMEGYGALFVPYGMPLLPQTIIFAFPEIAIIQGMN